MNPAGAPQAAALRLEDEGAGRARLIVANAGANLLRGASSAFLNVALPIALLHVLSVQQYAVWVLVYGVSAYALYLDLGLAVTTSTLVAQAEAAGDVVLRSSVVGGALRLLGVISVVILGGYLALAIELSNVFPKIPQDERRHAALGLVVLGVAQVVSLISNVFVGYFTGLQRSRVAATVISYGKLGTFAVALLVAVRFDDVLAVSTAYAIGTIFYVSWLFLRYMREGLDRPLSVRRHGATRMVVRLSAVIGALAMFMLLISGLDTAIVGRFAYSDLTPFGVAVAVGALVIGIFGAVLSPLLPEFTRLVALGAQERMVSVFLRSSTVATTALLTGVACLLLAAHGGISAIAGGAVAKRTVDLTVLIVLGAALRGSTTPLSIAIIALKDRRTVLLLPGAIEAIVNIAISIVLCRRIGAAGVAWGTICGAVCGAVAILLIAAPRCAALRGRLWAVAIACWFKPVILASPALAAGTLVFLRVGPVVVQACVAGFGVLCLCLIVVRLRQLAPRARAPMTEGDDARVNRTGLTSTRS